MKILIGSPVRQDRGIFIEYLKSLDGLCVPKGCEVDRYFILNDCEDLADLLKPGEYETLNTGDEYITNEETHIWKVDNLNKMSTLRNRLLEKVISEGYDYLFMVDSDLILNTNTLNQLLSANKALVAEVFWTAADKGYWANAWHYDQCTCDVEEVRKWLKPGLYKVGGTGACFLISRKVIEAGVNYSRIPNLKDCLWGEDRWFCIRAYCNNFDIWLDTEYPATHLYRKSEYKEYMKLRYGGGENGFIG